MLYGFILGVHLIVCVGLVLTVLLQSGKGGGLAGAFGGGGGAGQTLFGGRGAATFLSKATTVLGISFMTTSLVLALMQSGSTTQRSVLRDSPPIGTAPPPVSSQPIQLPSPGELTLPPVEQDQTSEPEGSEGGVGTPEETAPTGGTSGSDDDGG